LFGIGAPWALIALVDTSGSAAAARATSGFVSLLFTGLSSIEPAGQLIPRESYKGWVMELID